MGHDHIDNHRQAALVRLGNQPVGIVIIAEDRVDLAIIGYVIAEIGHRRGEERGNPDALDAEALHIIQPLDNTGQVTDTVAIAVLKRARVNLVEHGTTPPVGIE